MQSSGSDINIHANGITICYDDFGSGNVPLLFVHGFPFSKSMWKPQVEYFRSLHRVITYDIRGFGKSTAGAETASISLFAEDLIRLMDALEIEKARVCGLSMGGYIVLNAVNRYQKRFEAIILCDTQCIADSEQVKRKREETIARIESEGLQLFASDFIKSVFSKEFQFYNSALVEELKSIILSTPAEIISGTLTALARRWEMCSSLREISIPALILCGMQDELTPPAQSDFLFKNIGNSTIHIIDRAGHLSNLERPDEFNMRLNNFLASLQESSKTDFIRVL